MDETLTSIASDFQRNIHSHLGTLSFLAKWQTPVRTQKGGGGVEVENTYSVSPACRKRRLNGAVCRNHRIKRVDPCRCLDGHVKEPHEISMALGARPYRSNFIFSQPAHLCAVTYMTEISLIVTLNNQFTFTFTKWRHNPVLLSFIYIDNIM